jgi:hypothetical protein
MVICLRCGYCCREIWPGNRNDELEKSEPCPDLITVENGLCSCKKYDTRPRQCRDEHMGVGEDDYCPIGLMALDRGTVPRPTGKCMDCGGLAYDNDIACSESCKKALMHSLNRGL